MPTRSLSDLMRPPPSRHIFPNVQIVGSKPPSQAMINRLRTRIARLIVRHLIRPLPLIIQGWLWLAAEADELEEKRRCLNAVLQRDPENDRATLPLLVLTPKRTRS